MTDWSRVDAIQKKMRSESNARISRKQISRLFDGTDADTVEHRLRTGRELRECGFSAEVASAGRW